MPELPVEQLKDVTWTYLYPDGSIHQEPFAGEQRSFIEKSSNCDQLSGGAGVLGACSQGGYNGVQVSPNGGTPPYSILWSNGSTAAMQQPVPAGSYEVTVTDAVGRYIKRHSFAYPYAGSLTTFTDQACANVGSGRISTLLIGCEPYTAIITEISPNPGVILSRQVTELSNGAYRTNINQALSPGDYELLMIMDSGEEAQEFFTIDPGFNVSAVANVTSDANCGANDGSVTINVFNYDAPITDPEASGYTFSWSDGSSNATGIRNDLAPGNYGVTVTSPNCSCTGSTSFTIQEESVTDPGQISSFTIEFCGTDPDGQFIFSDQPASTSGSSTIIYQWQVNDGGGWEDIPGATGLTYDPLSSNQTRSFRRGAQVAGCPRLYSNVVTHSVFPTPGANVEIISFPSCNNNNGVVRAQTSGGTAPYSYSWSNGATTETVTGISPGPIGYTVTDFNGCQAVASVTVSSSNSQATDGGDFLDQEGQVVSTEDIFICGQATYKPNIFIVSPGSCSDDAPPTYQWYRADNSTSFNNAVPIPGATSSNYDPGPIPSGSLVSFWRLTRCDCDGDGEGELTNQRQSFYVSNLAVSLTANPDPLCAGESSTLTVNIQSDGYLSAGGSYTYSWSHSGSENGPEAVVSPSASTFYQVDVTDQAGCTAVASLNLEVTDLDDPDIIHPNEFTYYCGDATVTFELRFGPQDGVDYFWDFDEFGDHASPATATGPGPHTVTFTNPNPGFRHLIVTPLLVASRGECSTTENTVVILYSPPNAGFSFLDADCESGTGSITVDWFGNQDQTGPGNDIEFSIDGGDSFVSTGSGFFSGVFTFDDLAPGDYQIIARYARSPDCAIVLGEATISDISAPNISGVVTDVRCHGEATGSIDVSVTPDAPGYTYRWQDGTTTQDREGLRAGAYALTVTSAEGCSSSQEFFVGQPDAPITVSANLTDVRCFGEANGSIELDISGGTPGYSFLWSNGSRQPNISNLTAGTYTVSITDANDCFFTESYSISAPDALDVVVDPQSISCNGLTDGRIDVTVSGGTPPYEYRWEDGPTTQDRDDLSAGFYNLSVTDANECLVVVDRIQIIEPPALVVTFSTQDVRCNGEANGSIDVTVSGGTPPYEYRWDDGPTTQDRDDLSAGVYNLSVTDANDCLVTVDRIQIIEPDAITLSGNVTDLLCNGDNSGAIDLSVGGGTPPFTYSWSNGASTQDLSGLAAGTYSVIVSDANGCSRETAFTVSEPPALVVTFSAQDVRCNGEANGSIDVTVSGGTPPYEYRWDDGPTTQDRDDLSAGFYNLSVTDANDCLVTVDRIQIIEPDAITLSGNVTDLLCNGDNSGAIDLSVGGGTPPFTYSWSNGASTQDLSGLAADTYSVIVSDANGCSRETAFTVSEPPALVVTFSAQDVRCNGEANGSIDVAVSGGTPPYSYQWSDGPTSQDRSGLSAGTYSLDVRDANNCLQSIAVSIQEPAAITLSGSVTDLLCNGDNSGAIDLNVGGGTPPFVYSWSNGASTQDLSGLTAGTYSVIVSDANGCSRETAFTVSEPPALVVTFSAQDVRCNGEANGSIDVTVSGGTPPYSYQWSDGPTSQDRNGLSAGTYSLDVRDANNCLQSIAVSIQEPAAITLSGSITDLLCNGDNSGAIDLSVGGGTPPFTYSWSNGASTQDLSGLAAGTYSVIVSDANGCSRETAFTVSEPPALVVTFSAQDVRCNGEANGSIDVAVSGGTPPYSYQWSDGPTSQDRSGLSAGTYSLDVRDANNCLQSIAVSIQEPAAITLSGSVTDLLCNRDNSGAINLSVGGGTPPFTYSWSNGASTQDLSGLAAGTYSVIVSDANGCSRETAFTVSEPPALVVTFSAQDVRCNGEANGSIDVTVSGGTPPYSYQWQDGPTSQDRNGLSVGTYSLDVRDANNCLQSIAVSIQEPDAITLSSNVTDLLCNGDNSGAIDLSVGGGTPPFVYSWSNGASTQDLSGLAAGTYSVIVSDANGCSRETAFTVSEPPALVVTFSAQDVRCNGEANGSIDVAVSGGTPPYSYQWSDGPTSQDRNGLSAGTYFLDVRDANNCLQSIAVSIQEPAGITLSGSITDLLCNGDNSGAIDLSVGGGTPPFVYSWSNGASTQDLSGLAAGTYSVIVSDANGCSRETAFTVSEPPALVVTFSAQDVRCNGEANGSIDVTVSGGTPPYEYRWDDGPTTQDRDDLSAGFYNLSVTDANDCLVTVDRIQIIEPDAITLSGNVTDLLCNGDNSGAIDLSVGGGTPPFTYSWSNGASTQDLSGLTAGTYSVIVSDANGCSRETAFTVSEPPALLVTFSTQDVRCNGEANGSIDVSVSGGTPPYSYQWSDGPTSQDRNGLSAGTYSLDVRDANNCLQSIAVSIQEPDAITLSGSITDLLCNGDNSGAIDLSVGGGTPPFVYSWSNGASTQDLSGLAAGAYSVIVSDANGCSRETAFTVSEPPALVVTFSAQDVRCNGEANGSIDVAVSGGTPPYSYQWSDGLTSQDRNGLSAGTYSLDVRDANNCLQSIAVSIQEPDAITLSGSITDLLCNGDNSGAIDLNVGGGTPPFVYSWSNGASTQDLSGLAAGTYSVIVSDANGCSRETAFTVSEPPALAVTFSAQDVRCNGEANGSIDVTVSGGTPPYSYQWSDGPTSQDRNGLSAGTYSLDVRDANNCLQSIAVSIQEPDAITLSGNVTDLLCNGDNSGAIDLNVGGGTPPFVYSWSNGASTQDLSGLAAGTYSVIVSDANGCSRETAFTVSEPPALVVTFSTQDVRCNGEANGSIDVTVSGGTPPYSYQWSDGPTSQDRNGLSAGTYSLDVRDANNCLQSIAVSIQEPDAITLSGNITDLLCNGDNSGAIDLSVGGGTPPFTYSWSNGASTQDLSGLTAGTYSVIVSDANGCSRETAFTVSEPPALVVTFSAQDVRCNGEANGSIDVAVSGGTPPYSYQWSDGPTSQDRNGLSAGTYFLDVRDANNCLQSIAVTIQEPAAITLSGNVTDLLCNGDNSGAIDLSVGGGTPPFVYSWSNGASTQDLSGLAAGTYSVIVSDANGCSRETTFTVSEPPALTLSCTPSPISTINGNDGSILLNWEGGTPAYQITLNGEVIADTDANTFTISDLGPGDYTVVITDQNGCQEQCVATVNDVECSDLAVTLEGTEPGCAGENTGSITPNITGGSPPYTYQWSNGASSPTLTNIG
ncbi:SprB repeat-containing protein, partial [Lewinella sp. W8]|uniref:SprB repeat-containing protein n=1 Tax=Lewinella sp. W8 TaxID=2528208 RepID=UPI0015663885